MTPIQQHIDQQHGGNVSLFAQAVGVSRPTVYAYISRGSMWHAGRVWSPDTARPVGCVPELAAPYGEQGTPPEWATKLVSWPGYNGGTVYGWANVDKYEPVGGPPEFRFPREITPQKLKFLTTIKDLTNES